MKALTLWNPWAMLVAVLLKRFETRSWYTEYRGPLAIHAAKSFPRDCKLAALSDPLLGHLIDAGLFPRLIRQQSEFPFAVNNTWFNRFLLGAIVAICNLEAVYLITDTHMEQVKPLTEKHPLMLPLPEEPERSFGDYTPGRFAWLLTDVRCLPKPIAATGRQRLWEWTPPEGLIYI